MAVCHFSSHLTSASNHSQKQLLLLLLFKSRAVFMRGKKRSTHESSRFFRGFGVLINHGRTVSDTGVPADEAMPERRS